MAAPTIAIISDTHLPRGNRKLPAECESRLRAADLIIHAGDLTAASMLEQLRGIGEVAAVHGNADDAAVRALLPTRLELTVGDRARRRRRERQAQAVAKVIHRS